MAQAVCLNDKIKINLQIADSNYPLTINREEEQMVDGSFMREVGSPINSWFVYRTDGFFQSDLVDLLPLDD